MNPDRKYLTTPIYYVNDKPHIGHAYTTIAADVLARYHRSRGRDVFFLTGVDEHGQKVEKAASGRGITPQQHCDAMAPRFADLWKRLTVEPSAFIRTTDEAHRRFVTDALERLHAANLIVARDFEGWYCTPCERYWTEKDLLEGKCPECRREVEKLKERNYFFLMSRYAVAIRDAIASGRLTILPESRRNEVLGFLDTKALDDLCISRPKRRLSWGIPLPFDPEYVTYVWFDALLNYTSGPTYLAPRDSGAWWPASAHLLGKDIITTHAVYWPAMLMGLGWELPRALVAHGWWNFAGEKMSKSRGNVVDPAELIEEYSASGERPVIDAFRYFLLSDVSFGQDGTFSLEAFEKRWTADLSNDLGNLLSRVTALSGQILGGEFDSLPAEEDRAVVAAACEALEAYQFHRAIEAVIQHVRSMNQLLQARAPWANKDAAPEVLGRAAAVLRLASALLAPVMPVSAKMLAERLGLTGAPAIPDACAPFRAKTSKGEPLFERPARKKPAEAPASAAPAAPTSDASEITIDDFKKLDLRVGVIKTAEKVKGADRLLQLTVDIGTETRTLVAGIAAAYAPESLVGRSIVIVANLKPAKIRGITSHGMILAASVEGGPGPVVVAPVSEIPAGARVK